MRALALAVALVVGAATSPGLSAGQHAALAKSGAFGSHPVRVLMLGDSIALTLGIGLAHDAQSNYGVSIDNHGTLGCDLDPTLKIITSGKVGPATGGCGKWQALWPFLTASVEPDVVVLGVGRWEVSDHLYLGHWVHIGDPVWDAHVESELRQAAAIFRLFGAQVVLLTMPYIDPATRQPDGQPWPENTPAYAQRFNQLLRQVVRSEPRGVTLVDLNKMLSPHGTYVSHVDGVRVRWTDGVHVTANGGVLMQRQILPVIDHLGLGAEHDVAVTAIRLHKKVVAQQRAFARAQQRAAQAAAEAAVAAANATTEVRKHLTW